MSLDLAVLDEGGAPVREVPVPSGSHSELMRQAKVLELHQFLRMCDFYRDIDYTTQETRLLQQETTELAAKCTGKPAFCALINEIQSLVQFAVSNNKAVVAIAD